MLLTVLGNEVAVLQHDDGRLVRPGDLSGGRHEAHLRPGEEHDGGPRYGPDEVPDGVGLTGAGRPVEQDAALEVLALAPQLLAVLGEPDDVRAHLVERAVGQDHPIGGQVRSTDERDAAQRVLVGVPAEGDHLAGITPRASDSSRTSTSSAVATSGVGRQQLEPWLAAVLRVGGALQHRDRRAVVREEMQAEGDGRPVGIRPGREVEPVDLPLPETAHPACAIRSLSELWCRWSPPPIPSSRLLRIAGRDLGEREVDVDEAVGVDRLLHDRQVVGRLPEVRVEHGQHRRTPLLPLLLLEQLPHQAAERAPEAPRPAAPPCQSCA